MIAGITQSPGTLNPITNPEDNAKRRKKVLDDMLEQAFNPVVKGLLIYKVREDIILDQLLREGTCTLGQVAGSDSDYRRTGDTLQVDSFLAIQIEKQMDKDTIMESYLNTINLGQNCLGVQAAAKRYFGKEVNDLNLSECAVIAGITQ